MKESKLVSYDRDYVNGLLKRDILSMVGGLQSSGVIVREHEVEIEHSALGTYESHRLELKPIDGNVSIVRFKVPQVNEDGTMMVNGNKYSLRKQRVD